MGHEEEHQDPGQHDGHDEAGPFQARYFKGVQVVPAAIGIRVEG
jgi:hypothetical protein